MADILEQTSLYRIRQIEIAEAEYYKQLIKILDKIENDIVSLANERLTSDKGKLIRDARFSLALRPQIKSILEKEYLPWADRVVREGFDKQAQRVKRAFTRIGRVPKQFQELTKGDLALIQNLKQQSFTQFKDVSNTFTRTLQQKVYQNVLLGNERVVLEQELRQTINGIYASSKDPEINRLTRFVKDNSKSKNKAVKLRVDKAVQKLQTKFGRDRAGENMKRYAGQILNDSLREFDATLNLNKSLEAELTHVKYHGNVITTTRPFCAKIIRADKIYTISQVKKLWKQDFKGKKAGDPLIVRGGYNCRHQWSYVRPDWFDENGVFKI
jgi:hypothetical protein